MPGLGTRARADGFRHIHLTEVDSTNAEALRRGGDRLWVTAGRQSAGRGRRGRGWSSPSGNLYASLLLPNPSTAGHASELCFVAALALSDAIFSTAPRAGASLALKWPNDVLIAGAKVAGILIEASHGVDGLSAVIGCGVNIAVHPEGLPYPATRLAATDGDVDSALLFAALSDAFALRLGEWAGGAGFPTIRAAWLARAAGIGEAIRVRLPAGELEGVFEALDGAGALVLRGPDGGKRSIAAGEIFFPGVMAAAGAAP